MSIVELSFAAFALVGFLGIVGIVVIVTGRGPKSFNWKKNLDKKALKEDKSQTNFLEPEMPKAAKDNSTMLIRSESSLISHQTISHQSKDKSSSNLDL